jgi:antitoxin component of RelBE/YafQ-DinJ toxin-antitoxin module
MQNKMLNIKINKDLKIQAQKTATDLGLPLSLIIKNYLSEFIQEKQVIFSEHPFPNTKTQKILNQSYKDIKENKNLLKFQNDKEMDNYLLSL